ncbi:hypothetical protein [Actinoplanes sp. NPDC051494]
MLALGVALMALSLGSALLGQPAVAVLAGTGAVGVTRELIRRLPPAEGRR